MKRPSRMPVPRDDGLPLIRDPHGARCRSGLPQRVAPGVEGALPYLFGVVLHPSRLGEVLGKLTVTAPQHFAVLRKHHAGRARGTLIDRKH